MKYHLIDTIKITDYLLNLDHPDGHGKALFFINLGFSMLRIAEIKEALIQQAIDGDVIAEQNNLYGSKMVIAGNLACPAGKRAMIVTVWIYLHYERKIKFVTAYPFKK